MTVHCRCVCVFSHVWLFVAPTTIALQAPGKNTGVGCRDIPNPGIKPASLASSVLAGGSVPLRHLGSHCRLWVERKFVGIPLVVQWLKLHASIIGGKCSLGQLGDHGLGPHGRVYRKNRNEMESCKDLRVIFFFFYFFFFNINFIPCYKHFTFTHKSSQ